ncbi:unsaturated chondroitin disaccharide hydrolase [Bacillus pakistanensis]|uniref:Unsaturated chondroitin disaccharide hydrolase n=1 Tax=Rossellomorea pakistanensis TaxID=992288 RepID=A0ABS2NCE9_9BACI|nr:glycoside hydrolase family 88 protein [Bacillus pakistanensis]MBM7585545.1 unsaturated chondroitin disaccharide hydrolase [Bacillus pakistanensis]
MIKTIDKEIKSECIQKIERYETPPVFTKEHARKAIQHVLKKIDQKIPRFSHQFPAPCTSNNRFDATENVEWTPGFWTGMLWLAYEVTGDKKYRDIAEVQFETYRERIEKQIMTNTHDLGFLYTLSCVNAYKLTGNQAARTVALKAADLLLARFHEKAGIIQAWGDLTNPKQRGRMIIDCNMNLPLLYWASEETHDPKYKKAAYQHILQALNYIVREDASTYHTFYMNPETGEPIKGDTHQGYSDESCWSRGQAWGIYGFPLSYLYTKDEQLFSVSEKLSNYFLNRLPDDYICYWDLIFTNGEEERDSSAAAIAACGWLEMVKHMPVLDNYRRYYENATLHIISSLSKNYLTKEDDSEEGVLLHSVYNKKLGHGINESSMWGDYFYFEALVRTSKNWQLYW